jgi:hypothetical protein
MTPYLAALARRRIRGGPEPAKPTSSSSSIAPTVRAPSPPRTGEQQSTKKNDSAADLTIESCGRLPPHRPGRSSGSSR